MSRPSIDNMFSGKESKYALAIAVAKRAREITDELIQTNTQEQEKTVNMAIRDFKEHKYSIIEPDVNN